MDPATTTQDILGNLVSGGVIAGGVAAVDDGQGGTDLGVAGAQSLDGPPMDRRTIFRIQSMTKAITAVAALRLIARGELALDDSVEPLLPELAERRVLRSPTAALDDTVPATRPITVRHLLTCTSGYGMGVGDSPLGRAMDNSGVAAGPHPYGMDGNEWLRRLGTLPLSHQPGEGWRYHHSFSILGLLLDRATAGNFGEHLRRDVLEPLGMVDTGYWVADGDSARLAAAYRLTENGLVEVEPVGAGSNSVDPGHVAWHEELVSTVDDYLAFARMLRDRGVVEDQQFLPPDLVRLMTSDQVPDAAKSPESFGPDFWLSNGWGYGVGIENDENGGVPRRFGWSGGQGTDFSVDPTSGRITVMLTQTELGPSTFPAVLALR